MDHLFFHCQWVRDIWIFFLSCLNITWVFPRLIRELFSGWGDSGLRGIADVIWCYLSRVICWIVWKKRNRRIFNCIEASGACS